MSDVTLRDPKESVPLYVDKQTTIQLVKKAIPTKKQKYLDLLIRFLIDHHMHGHVTVHHISSAENPADLLTKALGPAKQRTTLPITGLHIRPSCSPVSVNPGERGTARLHADLPSPVLTDTCSLHYS